MASCTCARASKLRPESSVLLKKKQCNLADMRYLCHRRRRPLWLSRNSQPFLTARSFLVVAWHDNMFKGVAKLNLEKIKPRRLEELPDGESIRPRVAKGLDPTVWWLAGVNLKKKPLGSGTEIASRRRNTGQIQHYYVTRQAFPSGLVNTNTMH